MCHIARPYRVKYGDWRLNETHDSTNFKKTVKQFDNGNIVYINAINLTGKAIDLLREYIEIGRLTPIEEEAKKVIVRDKVYKVMIGDIICPQMFYLVKEV